MKSDWLLVIVAGYTGYKIGWVDGLTTVNLFLVLCLVIAVGAVFFQRSRYGKDLEEKRKEAAKADETKKDI